MEESRGASKQASQFLCLWFIILFNSDEHLHSDHAGSFHQIYDNYYFKRKSAVECVKIHAVTEAEWQTNRAAAAERTSSKKLPTITQFSLCLLCPFIFLMHCISKTVCRFLCTHSLASVRTPEQSNAIPFPHPDFFAPKREVISRFLICGFEGLGPLVALEKVRFF